MAGAGKYRDRVTIERPVRTTNPSGEVLKGWELHAARWAAVEAQGASESTLRDQTVADTRYRVTLRADATSTTITPQHRVLWLGRVLAIGGVQQLGLTEVILDCTARVTP